MVPTAVLLSDATGVTAQAEIQERNHFDLRSSTSSASLPRQGEAECSAEQDSIGWRVASSGLPEGQSKWWLVGRPLPQLTR